MIDKASEYRKRAEQVLALLRSESDPRIRVVYQNIAESWLNLAQAAVEEATRESKP